jgi:hypothetical protein
MRAIPIFKAPIMLGWPAPPEPRAKSAFAPPNPVMTHRQHDCPPRLLLEVGEGPLLHFGEDVASRELAGGRIAGLRHGLGFRV